MSKKFPEHQGLNLTQVNTEVLSQWKKSDIFRKTLEARKDCPQFVFYEGPPSANGRPGIHHVLARTIKDTMCRYKTMKGYLVPRKAGWDTHGLPVELGVEKELGITKADIDNQHSSKYISIKEYNERCRQSVMKYTTEWRKLTELMGYFVDLDKPYITYDNKYIETLWWLLKQLYEKKLLYKGYTIQPYSPAAGTGLSSHELNQPGCYRDVKDTTATVLFRVTNPKKEWTQWGTPCIAAWTTTPWTLPSNTALCVGPNITYVAIQTFNPYSGEPITVIIAEARVSAYFTSESKNTSFENYKKGEKSIPWRIIGTYKGSDLVGLRYFQLMPWFKPCVKLDAGTASCYAKYATEHTDKVFSCDKKNAFVEVEEMAFRVITGDFVTTEDGTGIVHIAPTFGADDAKVASEAHVPAIFLINKKGETKPMVDSEGKYFNLEDLDNSFVLRCTNTENYVRWAGEYVKNAYKPEYNVNGKYDEETATKAEDLNIRLCVEMKSQGQVFKIEKHIHNYPHCWRTDKPVLYYPLDSWFIRTTSLKERMSELNTTINWQPPSTGTGRFGHWLDNLNDWNLSRSRFWGTPLPIWRGDDGSEKCIGSLEELYTEIDKAVQAGIMKENPLKAVGFVPGDYSEANYNKIDLHRPYVDNIILVSDNGSIMRRETDLIDVWFDSGAMPYAQIHYPFENKTDIDAHIAFPADFINEGVDQTRGWFFTLHAIATMVFDSIAFKNVISSGLVLDAKGNKMSKHLGNVTDPFDMINTYGADAVRFYMITNSEPWDNLKFDKDGVIETQRKFFSTLHNTYSFFSLYANVDNFDNTHNQIPVKKRPEIDQWILSRLNSLIQDITYEMERYDPTRASRMIENFVCDDLSNWYVRLNRKRFWGKEMDVDKISAYQTLYTCLETTTKLLAPFAPFYAERLYNDLVVNHNNCNIESVHLEDYPKADEKLINKTLEAQMYLAQKITSMTLALRRKVNIKVRQPLQKIMIPVSDSTQKKHIEAVKQLILNEVNVKEMVFTKDNVKCVKCNFRTMGKKYGKLMKGIVARTESMTQGEIAQLENEGSITLDIDNNQIKIEICDVEIVSKDIPGWLVSNDGTQTVALEVTITDDLKDEGIARELINRIQNLRKDAGLDITDRINVTITPKDFIEKSTKHFEEYIKTQILANDISFMNNTGEEVNIDGTNINIIVRRV